MASVSNGILTLNAGEGSVSNGVLTLAAGVGSVSGGVLTLNRVRHGLYYMSSMTGGPTRLYWISDVTGAPTLLGQVAPGVASAFTHGNLAWDGTDLFTIGTVGVYKDVLNKVNPVTGALYAPVTLSGVTGNLLWTGLASVGSHLIVGGTIPAATGALVQYYRVNKATGAASSLGDPVSGVVADMAWDGATLYTSFFSAVSNRASLYIVSQSNGTISSAGALTFPGTSGVVTLGALTWDGSRLLGVVTRTSPRVHPGTLYEIPRTGGTCTRIGALNAVNLTGGIGNAALAYVG